MATTELAPRQNGAAIIEQVIAAGDLSKLSPEQRSRYYVETCESLGLNPLTQPFIYVSLNNKLTLYATRTATDQLRSLRGVSIRIVSRERVDDLYVVTAQASLADGRSDEAQGAVSIAGLRGDALANALLRAETKAKRRVTLSIVGLGFNDESELDTVPGAARIDVAPSGEIVQPERGGIWPADDDGFGQAARAKPVADVLPARADAMGAWQDAHAEALELGIPHGMPARTATVEDVVARTADLRQQIAAAKAAKRAQ